ncbi:MAG: energy-coupling factor transporter transmembrane component T [Anaerovorax sp.]|nr:energy-coupling factor transporter transmembrane component T [Anaerovorax sp.]
MSKNKECHVDAFSSYHPLVNFLYFVFVLGFSMVFMHPVCLGISLVVAFTYSIYLKEKKAILFNFGFLAPMLIVTAILNPAFNHEGQTILMYFSNGNPLTLESILYGIAAATMLSAVICWFSCYNEVMTSDKFIYLFGRVIPALSLILSMVLRFVPRFKAQIKKISYAQKCIGRDLSNGSWIQKSKNGITILSIMITWALENAIETAESMKSRGYGLPGRTAFSIYRFDRRDKKALLYIGILGIFVLVCGLMKVYYFRYYPTVKGNPSTIFFLFSYAVYFTLCIVPIVIDVKENRQWKATQLNS